MTWKCELVEKNEPFAPDIWRVFDEGDDSYEATICVLECGEHDNEELANEICQSHNNDLRDQLRDVIDGLKREAADADAQSITWGDLDNKLKEATCLEKADCLEFMAYSLEKLLK